VKGKRTGFEENSCAVARSLGIIGDWWSLLIIRDALSGKRRFSEFQKHLGLAKNILSARLAKLVDQGIMKQVPAADGSAYRDYVLTEKGEKLYLVIAALWQWGEEFCFSPGEAKPFIVDAVNDEALAPLELRTTSGRSVGPRGYKPMTEKAKAGM
jgi:DNA-binding HxlR family transcriptional regulator